MSLGNTGTTVSVRRFSIWTHVLYLHNFGTAAEQKGEVVSAPPLLNWHRGS